jgi:hypothetical protein
MEEDEHGLYWRTPLANSFPEPPKTKSFYCMEYEDNGYRCEDGQCSKCAKMDEKP